MSSSSTTSRQTKKNGGSGKTASAVVMKAMDPNASFLADKSKDEMLEQLTEAALVTRTADVMKGKVLIPSANAPKLQWQNKQRVLVFGSRGISGRVRHLMDDIRCLMPHSKKDAKLDKKDGFGVINEVCEMKHCNNALFFEMRRCQDVYMWLAKVPSGPSMRFLVENVHCMDELKLTGNCLKGSRPLLSFDSSFDLAPEHTLMKEVLTQIFGTPLYHPKSKPFIDHVISFSLADNRVWFRNYQIVDRVDEKKKTSETSLVEIGPRFTLNPIKIFSGSFGGEVLWENPLYTPPNEHRKQVRYEAAQRYKNKQIAVAAYKNRAEGFELPRDELEEVFQDKAYI